MALEYWWVLVICLAVGVAVIAVSATVAKKKSKKSKKTIYFANTQRLTSTPEYQRLYKKYRAGIFSIAALAIVSALTFGIIAAKPVQVESQESVKYSRDIVLCLDVSGSMATVDSNIISKFQELSKGFKGERISLVIFNSTANQVFPLTDDYSYMQSQLSDIKKGLKNYDSLYDNGGYDILSYTLNGQGSSLIGDGLTACTLNFDKEQGNQKRSRSVILATDNAVNGKELISLKDAAQYAKKQDIKVYAIDPVKTSTTEQASSLKEAAETTGGSFYDLSDPNAVPQIIDKITSEQTTAAKGELEIVKKDNPQPWLFIGGLAFLVILTLAWRFKV